jgi:CheY-like chemotaxis protein
MSAREPIILLAEDDENDIFFMRRALQKAEVDYPLHVARNGQETLDYLSGAGQFADRDRYPVPSILFLDLKMPFVDGFDVLAWIQSQSSLKDKLPVVVLTSSSEDRDRRKVAEFGAKAYCVKPPGTEMIREMMRLTKAGGENVDVSAPRCFDLSSNQ